MASRRRTLQHLDLGRRERQIMEVVYRRGRATVSDILGDLASPPSYSAVRTMVGKLEEKGLLRHHADGPRYVYEPVAPRDEVGSNTLRRVVTTLFAGSTATAVSALLDVAGDDLSPGELDELAELIDRRRRQGR